jgi:hypothetical protein
MSIHLSVYLHISLFIYYLSLISNLFTWLSTDLTTCHSFDSLKFLSIRSPTYTFIYLSSYLCIFFSVSTKFFNLWLHRTVTSKMGSLKMLEGRPYWVLHQEFTVRAIHSFLYHLNVFRCPLIIMEFLNSSKNLFLWKLKFILFCLNGFLWQLSPLVALLLY